MSDPNDPADKEHFGEASLADARAENAPDDPEYIEGENAPDAPDSDQALTDVPALEPIQTDDVVDEEAEAAAAEAASIGGVTPTDGLPEAERPLAEAGEGVSEGFELSEERLIENASHAESHGHPLGDAMPVEEAGSQDLAEYGEADYEHSSENTEDDH